MSNCPLLRNFSFSSSSMFCLLFLVSLQERTKKKQAISEFQKLSLSKCSLRSENDFFCMRIKIHFHINGSALSLAFKQRLGASRKWPIVLHVCISSSSFFTGCTHFHKALWKNTRNSLLCLCSCALYNKQKKLKCRWRFDVILSRNIFVANSWRRIFFFMAKKKRGNNILNYFGARRFSRECCVQKIKLLQYPLWF